MSLQTNFLNQYNGLAIHQAGSISLGIGTFRCYINSSVATLNVGDYGVSRWFALTTIQDSGIASLSDREIPADTSSIPWSGHSTGSSLLSNITMSAGMTIYGDFTNIKLTSGSVLMYGI